MNSLPNIYQSTNRSYKRNNKEMCIVEEQINNNVEDTLRSIHTGLGDYNTRVLIETEDNVYDTKIISKGNKEILTENNKLIPINKIVDIKIKK